ncbi:MAG: hypothetical protein H6732_10695 [Alphaproteobacteria bacterium]|nr:hypothetical protein [Alphaproteobacteria bacterium]
MDADESLASPARPDPEGADAAHAATAETVREALVRLRGGAPFLSAADTALLVGWLDAGVGVSRILAALEVTANRRLARRIRAPLELRHARAEVAKAKGRHAPERLVASAPLPAPGDLLPPLDHLDPAVGPAIDALRATIDGLDGDPDALADGAAVAVIAFFDAAWRLLGVAGRARYHDRAADALGDLLDALDEGERAAVVEAHGRALLRADAAGLSVTALLERLEAR